jgi:KDO2-lipid IV(A) lauroyltransferase
MKWVRKFLLDPLEFLPLFFMYSIFKLLPVQVSSAIGGILARWVGPWLPVHKIGQENIARAFPQKSLKEREIILEKAWENLGRVMGEFPHLKKIAHSFVEVIDHYELAESHIHEVPVVFFSAHMANWEVPHLVLTLRQMRISLLSRPPNNWLTRGFFEWVRYDPLVSIILKGGEGSKDLLRLFQEKGNLGILLDQRLSEGEKLPFFGQEAYTPTGPARLAEKFKAIMVPVQVERLKGIRFRITYHKPLKVEKDFLKTSLKINQIFEGWIEERPDQWLWFHNRWKL